LFGNLFLRPKLDTLNTKGSLRKDFIIQIGLFYKTFLATLFFKEKYFSPTLWSLFHILSFLVQ